MALWLTVAEPIPQDLFKCPSNISGVDYVALPWSNMSQTVFGGHVNDTESFCGIKGNHPRMFDCCRYGQLPGTYTEEIPLALANDSCTQYCPFRPIDVDAWIYCLTLKGDSASNAFCRNGPGYEYETSGSLPRSGSYNIKNPVIQVLKDKYNTAVTVSPSALLITSALILTLFAQLGLA